SNDAIILSVSGTAISFENIPSNLSESLSIGKVRKIPCSLLHIRGDYRDNVKNICKYCGQHPATNKIFSSICLPESMPMISMDCNAAFKIETQILVNENLIYGIRTGNIYEIGKLPGSTTKNKNIKKFGEDNIFEKFPLSPLGQYTELSHIQNINLKDEQDTCVSSNKLFLIESTNYLDEINQFQILSKTFSTYAFGAQIPSDESLSMIYFDEFPKILPLDRHNSECHSNILSKFYMNEEDYLHVIVTQTIHIPNSTSTESTISTQQAPSVSFEHRRTARNRDINNNILMTNLDHLPFSDESKFINLGYINHCLIKESFDIRDVAS
ncbi:hypothetical protein MXB_2163, partial [Myxobolus squamalis]